jgi:hypothetical protein
MSKIEGYNIVFRLLDGRMGARITAEADEQTARVYLKERFHNAEIVSCHGMDRAALAAAGLPEAGFSWEWISKNNMPEKKIG